MRECLIILCVLFSAVVQCQEVDTAQLTKPVFFQIEGGYLLGAEVSNNDIIVHSGLSGRISSLKQINPTFSAGIGLALDQYDQFRFTSIFGQVQANTNPENSGRFVGYVGYSFASEPESTGFLNQEFEEGLFLELGRQWNFPISKKLDFLTVITFKHQFSELEFKTASGETLEQPAHFESFHVRFGLRLNR